MVDTLLDCVMRYFSYFYIFNRIIIAAASVYLAMQLFFHKSSIFYQKIDSQYSKLCRQNMSAAMEVFILPRHHDHQRACYPDDPDVEELPAMAAFEVEETNAYSVTEAAAHEAVAEESDLLFTESLLRQA